MKKLLSHIICLFAMQAAFTQVNTSLILNPAPAAVLSEWQYRKDVLNYIVDPGPGVQLQVKIKTEIVASDGTVVATTDLARARIITLSGQRVFLSAADVLPLDVIIFSGSYKDKFTKTGKLPSGNYQLCVQLVRPDQFVPVSQQQCRPFFLAAIQLPIQMMPARDSELDATQAETSIIFRWTPVVPPQTPPVIYKLQVFEVLENQQPIQAMRANQPLLNIDVRGQTQHIWRPQLSLKADTLRKRFIWNIQTLDASGTPLVQTDGNGESRSEPQVFYVISKLKPVRE